VKYALALLLVICHNAVAEDNCKDVLIGGVFNQTTSTSSETANRAMYAQLCASDYNEAQKIVKTATSSSSGGSVGLSIKAVGLNVDKQDANSNSFTQEEFNKWKADSCNTTKSSEASAAADYLMQSLASEAIVQAWAQCMTKREGLTCWASPFEEKDAIFTVSWNKQSTTKATVVSTDISNDAVSKMDGSAKGKLLPANYQLDPGILRIPLTRSAGKSVQIVMNTNHAGTNSGCEGYIPSGNDFKLKTVVAPARPQKTVDSGSIGCSVQAMGSPCGNSWTSAAPDNYKVCTATLQYTSGPTSGATMNLSKTNNSVTVNWTVSPSMVPFGPGRWVRGVARVVYVPNDRNADDAGTACGA